MEHIEYLHAAVEAAQEAARIQRYYIGGELDVATKSTHTDLVTKVDKLCEQRIRELLLSRYPDHVVLGEEMGQPEGDASHRWIVDPLDGTLNYAHGFPFYCVSVALEIEGRITVGVVLDSARHEMFTAVRGGGAYLDGAPIRVSSEDVPSRAMVGTGFAYDPQTLTENVSIFGRMLPQVRAIRRPGAAALDLSYVACGRLDGFWELNLKPWDVAAGWLLIEEAGGTVSGPDGRPYRLEDRALVATNGPLHGPLIELLALEGAQA